MTTLVTGGTGFLGRHLVASLVDRGEDVRVFTRSFDLDLAELGVEICEGSLTDAEDVCRAVDGVTRVYHLAGRVERDPKWAHLMYELHVDGTRRLLDALREQKVEKIVYASTSGTVGVGEDAGFIADDEAPMVEGLVKRWPYYLSKIYAERVVDRFVADHDLPVVTMRPTLLLGPGDWRESSTGDVVRFLQRKVPGVMSGGMSFVDVRDVADAFILAMESATPGEKYLLGADNLTIADFLKRLEHITGVKGPKLPLPDSAAIAGAKLLDSALKLVGKRADVDPTTVDMARYYWYIDSSKAERELGWSPRAPDETLRDTVSWVQTHHPELSSPAATRPRPAPPGDFVPRETVEYAEKLRGER